MPKNVSTTKTASGATVKRRPYHKFRIGTRKSGKSALMMSNDELKDVLNDKNKKRYHSKAAQVLKARGIEVEWPKKLVKQASLEDVAEEMRGNTAAN